MPNDSSTRKDVNEKGADKMSQPNNLVQEGIDSLLSQQSTNKLPGQKSEQDSIALNSPYPQDIRGDTFHHTQERKRIVEELTSPQKEKTAEEPETQERRKAPEAQHKKQLHIEHGRLTAVDYDNGESYKFGYKAGNKDGQPDTITQTKDGKSVTWIKGYDENHNEIWTSNTKPPKVFEGKVSVNQQSGVIIFNENPTKGGDQHVLSMKELDGKVHHSQPDSPSKSTQTGNAPEWIDNLDGFDRALRKP